MVTDNNFIYLNRKAHSQGFSFPSGPNRVQKVNKITLLTEETVDVGAAGSHNTDPRTNGFINQNDYLLGGQSFRNINKYDKDTLSGTTLLNITGSDIARYINSDGEKIFVGATAKL